MRTRFDIGQIIQDHGEKFLSTHKVVTPVRKACKRPKVIKTLLGRAFQEARLFMISLKFNLF